MRIYRLFVMSAVFFLLSVPGFAADDGKSYGAYLEMLNTVNASRPEQSPHNERSGEILTDRILDKKNRVIGEVRDVFLRKDGGISMLDLEFDRLKIGTDRLVLGYDALQIRPVGNGYQTGFEKEQIVEMFPRLLAGIDTGAGEGAEDEALSLRKLRGARVLTDRGRVLGKVEDVLFDDLGGRAKFLYIGMAHKTMRGRGVSVPFDMVSYRLKGSQIEVSVDENLGRAIADYAKK